MSLFVINALLSPASVPPINVFLLNVKKREKANRLCWLSYCINLNQPSLSLLRISISRSQVTMSTNCIFPLHFLPFSGQQATFVMILHPSLKCCSHRNPDTPGIYGDTLPQVSRLTPGVHAKEVHTIASDPRVTLVAMYKCSDKCSTKPVTSMDASPGSS